MYSAHRLLKNLICKDKTCLHKFGRQVWGNLGHSLCCLHCLHSSGLTCPTRLCWSGPQYCSAKELFGEPFDFVEHQNGPFWKIPPGSRRTKPRPTLPQRNQERRFSGIKRADSAESRAQIPTRSCASAAPPNDDERAPRCWHRTDRGTPGTAADGLGPATPGP